MTSIDQPNDNANTYTWYTPRRVRIFNVNYLRTNVVIDYRDVERDRVLCKFRRGRDLQVHEIDVQPVAGRTGNFDGFHLQLRGRSGQ